MTETTARIRWHHVDGTVVEWFGFVGTVTAEALFQILHPVAKPTEDIMGRRFDEWALCTTFPGYAEQVRYGGRDDGAQDRLKAEAERWLEEFAASLGAVFRAGPEVLPHAPLIHDLAIVLRGVLHPGAAVGPPARLASRRLADVLGIADGEANSWNVQARLRAAFGVAPDGSAKKVGQ
jgi:hypothetical protein